MKIQRQIKISKSFFENLGLFCTDFFYRLLVFLQLRRPKEFWGIIYDSVSKQPLDPVRVVLVYADTGKVEGECITDLGGRYGFLARPGKFKIFPQKSNYKFPSKIVNRKHDLIYYNIYRGEFFEIKGESEVIAPNIPMDPLAVDWNQSAKLKIMNKPYYTRWVYEIIIGIIFWSTLLYVCFSAYRNQFNNVYIIPIIFLYLVIFTLAGLLPEPRLWGKISQAKTNLPISGINLTLSHLKFPNIRFGVANSEADGKYFLRANPGKYNLIFTDSANGEKLGSVVIKIGKSGVLNRAFKLEGL